MVETAVISSVLGWLSIGCWIIVYSPQLLENYQLKSGEGLSVAFVLIWLAGDLTNLVGALMAHLLPTVIIIAIYYTLCDLGLFFQIHYYRRMHPVHIADQTALESSETTPLLQLSPKNSSDGRPFYKKMLRRLAPYVSGTCFVLAVGTTAYWINVRDGQNNKRETDHEKRNDVLEWKSQLFGWISAILYLGSRIPQIFKNLVTKCAGLSPVLFFFAIIGNAAYVASILVVSIEPKYLAVNASWLAGSSLTIFLDFFVLAQFIYFRTTERVFVPDRDHV